MAGINQRLLRLGAYLSLAAILERIMPSNPIVPEDGRDSTHPAKALLGQMAHLLLASPSIATLTEEVPQ